MNVHEPLTPLLDLDADLGRLLGPERAAEAHAELGVRVCLIERGPWDAGRLATAHPENLTPTGVAIPMTLSDRVLAQLVGARRPTVSTALAELAEREELVRRRDGTWLLLGDPIGVPDPEAARVIEHRRGLLPPESPLPVEVLEVPHSTLSEWVLTGNGRPLV